MLNMRTWTRTSNVAIATFVRGAPKPSVLERASVLADNRAMDEDLIEPGGSNTGTQNEATSDREHEDLPPPEATPTKTAAAADAKFTWTSPAERAAIEMSKRRKMTRMKASIPYLALSCTQTALGVAIVAVGGAAFATAPSFPAGCFWAGLLVLLLSIYSLTLLCLKLTLHRNKWFKKCKHALYGILIALCIVCILTTIAATVMDMLAAYMLHRTDFSRCLHTDSHLTIDCDTDICPNMILPPNTCYCCYLYHHRKAKGCDTPFLLDKPAFFEGVDSCSVLSDRLHPLLTTVGLLCLASTAVNIIFLFKSRPVRYYVKNETGEEVEVGEGEGEGEGVREGKEGFVGKLFHKLKRTNSGKGSDVKYTAADTDDTTVE